MFQPFFHKEKVQNKKGKILIHLSFFDIKFSFGELHFL